MIGKEITVTVDRPLGSVHPRYANIVYPVNYGYVEGITGGDGEEQDVYILGIDRPIETFTGKVIAVVRRLNDDENKWITAPDGVSFTKEEITAAVYFQEKYFDFEVIT